MVAEDMLCGIGVLKINAGLQRFATLRWYSLACGLCILGVVAVFTYISAVISTSQVVFSFSTTDIGIWYALIETGAIISSLVVSYFFAHKNIPNILTVSLFIMVIGSLMHGLPHFFIEYENMAIGPSEGVSTADLILKNVHKVSNCSLDQTGLANNDYADSATDKQSSINAAISKIYYIGGFVLGVGYAPFWSMGLAYIDNNVKHVHESTKYIGGVMVALTLGPVVGYGVGGWLLTYYVTLEETYLTLNDTQWIGAYWMGYLVFAAYMALLIPFTFMFPKRLPQQGESRKVTYNRQASTSSTSSQKQLTSSERVDGIDNDGVDDAAVTVDDKNHIRSLKGYLPTFGRLLINPLYMLEVIASCCGCYYLAGWIGFLPKYYEVQFNFSASISSIYAGVLPPLFSAVGVFIGGWLSSKYKLNTQQNAIFLFASTLIATIFMIPFFFLTCDQFPVMDPPASLASCVRSCDCDLSSYDPVCYQGTTYRSPCIVGCNGFEYQNGRIAYTGCLCEQNVTMTGGMCSEESCSLSTVYIVFAIISCTAALCSSSAGVNIILRSVSPEDKSFALGLQSSLNSLLGWIPAPILYGALIDSTCKLWEYPNSEEWKGYCLEYVNQEFTDKFSGISVGVMALASLFCGLSIPVSYMERYMDKSADNNDASSSSDSNSQDVKMDQFDQTNS